LRARGGRVDYVVGNHDFRLGPRLRSLCDHVGGPLELELGGLRLLLAHGDEADRSWGYRLTRALLRSEAFDRSVLALGEARARSLLAHLAGASRHRPASPGPLVDAQRAWAAPRLRAGVQAVLMGHIHVLELAPLGGGCVVHTGDWASRRSWCWIGEGELGLMEGPEELARWAPTRQGG
jgi:UDP-2,3-diacylglucosamine pyrophosphatase LpxH